MIETVILVLQIMCAGLLGLGLVLSLVQFAGIKVGSNLQHFSFAAANDFETNFVRIARSAQSRC